MPVRYQCPGCSRWLSISRKKIGVMVACPGCGAERVIPERDDGPGSASDPTPSLATGDPFPGELAPQTAEPPFSPPVFESPAGQAEIVFAELPEPASAPVATPPAELEFAAWEEEPVAAVEEPQRELQAELRRERSDAIEPLDEDFQDDSHAHEALADDEEADDEEDDEPAVMFSRRKGEFEDMDLTPMVDMMILLLMFFMVTTSKELQKSLEMPAPGADGGGATQALFTPEQLEETTIRIRIDDKNVVYIEDEAVASNLQILEKIKVQMRNTQRYELTVSADPQAFHETVVAVVDAAQAAGAQKIRMSGGGGEY